MVGLLCSREHLSPCLHALWGQTGLSVALCTDEIADHTGVSMFIPTSPLQRSCSLWSILQKALRHLCGQKRDVHTRARVLSFLLQCHASCA